MTDLTNLKIQSVEKLRDARIRYDQAVSDSDKEEALREYDIALAHFRKLTGITSSSD